MEVVASGHPPVVPCVEVQLSVRQGEGWFRGLGGMFVGDESGGGGVRSVSLGGGE